MDSNIITLIIGLAGITGTTIASGLGLYFTSKARSAALRELIYKKQADLITQIIHKQESFWTYAMILSSKDPEFKTRAREDIRICLKEYSDLLNEAITLVPIKLLSEIKMLHDHMIKMIVTYDDTSKIEKALYSKLSELLTKVAVVSRVVLGVDKLTKESLKLLSITKDYDIALRLKFDDTGNVLIGKKGNNTLNRI